MPFFDGKSICAFSFAINSIHVGTLFQKKGYHGFVTIVRGPNQWRSEIESGVPSINICTCLDQVSCNANISVTHSFEKTLVPFSLHILSQKKLRHFLKAHASSSNNTQTSTTEKKRGGSSERKNLFLGLAWSVGFRSNGDPFQKLFNLLN